MNFNQESRAPLQLLMTASRLQLVHLPMHWDAEDPLHGGEDLGHDFLAPVSSMLRDDDGFIDVCKESVERMTIMWADSNTRCTHSYSTSHKSSTLNACDLFGPEDSA